MRIRDFEIDKDFGLIKEWIAIRDIPMWEKDSIPKIGKIVSEDNIFQAIGFLRVCEGHLGIMDSLISNPLIERTSRSEAMDMLIQSLIEKAISLKLKAILGITVIPSLEERVVLSHGFKKHGCSVLVLNL